MTGKRLSKLKNGYVISLVVHLILMLLLALWIVRPALQVKWQSFEWEPGEQARASEASPSRGLTHNPGTTQTVKAVSQTQSAPVSPVSPVSVGDLRPALEQPKIADSSPLEQKSDAVRAVRSLSRGTLKSLGENLPGGNFGFSSSLEEGGGEAYIISQPKPAIMPTEEGEVYLEFRLTAKGFVDMGSVNVLSYTTASYAEAVQKVLKTWRFGFKGTYNPNRTYRIRCKFVVDEG